MGALETIFLLLFVAVLIVGIAQKLHVPYPIALIISGTAIGFIPGLKFIQFDPQDILLIVLPPILYYAAFGISFREFIQNWRDIFSLALGLVVATTLIIAAIFKWMFPDLSWELAFAFGAIVSPPDAVAATSILKRFSISSRLVVLLEGESLVNDASALVLYKLAVLAILSGSFSAVEGGKQFFVVIAGGILLGVVLGFILQLFSRRYLEPILGVVFSFLIPYIVFILATYFEVSGVLAVVISGLLGSRIIVTHHSSLRRVLGFATWDIFTIFLNCFVFILMGLQLRTIAETLSFEEMILYTFYSLLIMLAMVVVRMFWVYGRNCLAYVKAYRSSKASVMCPQILGESAVIGWAGMRGIVSLTAALALPYTLSNGDQLIGRDEVVFMTFMVILFTLLIPGLTLPFLIKWLKIPDHTSQTDEKKIREQLAKVAEDKLHRYFSDNKMTQKELLFLRRYFTSQQHVMEMSHSEEHAEKNKVHNVELIRLKVINAQRKHLLELWRINDIDDKLLNHLENELDMVEVHTARAELK